MWNQRKGAAFVVFAWTVWLVSLGGCASAGSNEEGMFRWAISTAVEIDAPPARVWEVLVDLAAYREWNPFIVEANGTVAVGETLSLRMALPGRSPMTIEPRLLVVEPGRELRWKGRLFLPGLFDGEHWFSLAPLAGDRTRLDHSERFAGLLLPLLRGMIYESTLEAFHALNAALAARVAEQRVSSALPPTAGTGASDGREPAAAIASYVDFYLSPSHRATCRTCPTARSSASPTAPSEWSRLLRSSQRS